MAKKEVCDANCLECKFPDCIAITPAEREKNQKHYCKSKEKKKNKVKK